MGRTDCTLGEIMIYPVILCGGSGTRLWPLSRRSRPKQFLPLATNQSLLQETTRRVAKCGFAAPMMICNNEHRFLVSEQLREIGVKPAEVILEPSARSTAPAATVASLMARVVDNDALILLLPSDHIIGDADALAEAVAVAAQAAADGYLVTFGIAATKPETGYGYIRRGTLLKGFDRAYFVDQFIEKPSYEMAKEMLAEGDYDWNSGMFLFSAAAYLGELSRLNPVMLFACQDAVDRSVKDLDFRRLDADAFNACPSESIDVAVMEKTDKAAVVPADLGWSDVGSWSALWSINEHDECDNVLKGDVIAHEVSGSYLRSDGPVIATFGLTNMVVVATEDAVLVAPKDRADDVKIIVERFKLEGRSEHHTHLQVHRPWGWYKGVDAGDGFQVKRICVNSGARLSLQYHNHRAEHWVVVSGTARVTRGEDTFDLDANQSAYIPVGVKHRLENSGSEPLHMIEVQSGSYLGEDDIVRLDDDFRRT